MDHASLIPVLLRLARDPGGERDPHEPPRAIDVNAGDRIELRAEKIPGEVRVRFGGVATRDEERGTEVAQTNKDTIAWPKWFCKPPLKHGH